MTPAVSIVIPARNEERVIGACVAALCAQTLGPERLQVIVVAAGDDATAEVAAGASAGCIADLDVVRLGVGNKNAALRAGCGRARADTVVLLDADTQLAPDALAVLHAALARDPARVVHGAAVPRVDTWISRYWELNRRLVKDLQFDRTLSGEVVALPRRALEVVGLAELFPDGVGAKDDLWLGRALAAHGWRIGYEPAARATTLVPWTLSGLLATMLRNRRGAMAVLPLGDAAAQAAKSALLVGALPAALAIRPSPAGLVVGATPLVLHALAARRKVATLAARGLGDHGCSLATFVTLDVLGRTLKLWAFGERLVGRRAPRTFRGQRPGVALAPERPSEG